MSNVEPMKPGDPKTLDEVEEPSWPYIFLLLGLVAAVVAFALLAFGRTQYAVAFPALLSIASFALAIWGFVRRENDMQRRRQERLNLLLRGQKNSTDYFEQLVNINVENLSAYYAMVKRHTNKSFYASLIAGLIGFALIATGIRYAVVGAPGSVSVPILSGLSGVVTEFISAIFFYLYSKTVRQLKEYHDSLLVVQNILLSFKLVGDTADPKEKAAMISKMLEYLVRQVPPSHPVSEPETQPKSTRTLSERGAQKAVYQRRSLQP